MQLFTPTEYLKIDIASTFGLDKQTWDDRIAWFNDNQDKLDDLVKQAESPALFYAGIQAYRQAAHGEAIAYPISLDATASGAQLLAILVGCEQSARMCNVIDTGAREDFYTGVYEAMKSVLSCWIEERDIDSNHIPALVRQQVKDAVMPAFYGSKQEPRTAFGEGVLLEAFYHTMETRTPGLWELVQSLVSLWQPDVVSHDWILPDNFNVNIKVMNARVEEFTFMGHIHEAVTKVNVPLERSVSLAANIIHSIDGMVVREMLRRCSFDPVIQIDLIEALLYGKHDNFQHRPKDQLVQALWKHYEDTGFLSVRILDSLDRNNLGLVNIDVIKAMIESMPNQPFPVLSVHDCFRVHPNHANDLRMQYNQILHDLAQSTLVGNIASQILGHPVALTKTADFADRILSTNYALS